MKKLILSSAFALLHLSGFAQNPTAAKLNLAPTSQEEYNYATKGLKTQRAQGLDMKAGYVLDNKMDLPMSGTTITIEDLIRKTDQSLACIVVQLTNPKWSEPVYLAIPNASTGGEIYSQYAKALSTLDLPTAKTLLYCVSARLSGMETIVVKMAK